MLLAELRGQDYALFFAHAVATIVAIAGDQLRMALSPPEDGASAAAIPSRVEELRARARANGGGAASRKIVVRKEHAEAAVHLPARAPPRPPPAAC